MFPDRVQAPDIPYQALQAKHLLFDLIYNPEKTGFLKKGEEKKGRKKTQTRREMTRPRHGTSWCTHLIKERIIASFATSFSVR